VRGIAQVTPVTEREGEFHVSEINPVPEREIVSIIG
jgi:hypothetical protein